MKGSLTLAELGWDDWFDSQMAAMEPPLTAARVAVAHRDAFVVLTPQGEIWTQLAGRMRYRIEHRNQLPVTGDWVGIADMQIRHLFERRTKFSRQQSGDRDRDPGKGKAEEQVLAANIDYLFLVTALDAEFNVRRIERYIAIAWEEAITPVVVLNKADLYDSDDALADVAAVAPGVEKCATSAHTGEGVDTMRRYLTPGRTAVLVGSSGVGKTSLINAIAAGVDREVRDVRKDSRGRHTTTRRELFALDAGGLIIDTPGLRELQPWTADTGLSRLFTDFEAIAGQCRFSNCSHTQEPGCALLTARGEGSIDEARYQSYIKLLREQAYLGRKKDRRLREAEEKRWRSVTKLMRDHYKSRP